MLTLLTIISPFVSGLTLDNPGPLSASQSYEQYWGWTDIDPPNFNLSLICLCSDDKTYVLGTNLQTLAEEQAIDIPGDVSTGLYLLKATILGINSGAIATLDDSTPFNITGSTPSASSILSNAPNTLTTSSVTSTSSGMTISSGGIATGINTTMSSVLYSGGIATTSLTTVIDTSTDAGSKPSTNEATASHSNLNIGTIIGAIGGALVAVALISFLVLFYRRKKSQTADQSSKMDLTHDPERDLTPERAESFPRGHFSSNPLVSDFPYGPQNGPLVHPDTSQTPMTTPQNYERHTASSTTLSYDPERNQQLTSAHPQPKSRRISIEHTMTPGQGTNVNQDQSISPHAQTPRFIRHTDIEETMQVTVELPPEYSENRAPLASFTASGPLLTQSLGVPEEPRVQHMQASGSKGLKNKGKKL